LVSDVKGGTEDVREKGVEKICGPKRDGVKGWWRKLHNDELYNLYSLPSILRMIRLRRMRWEGHLT
jgi:hypothetical protein